MRSGSVGTLYGLIVSFESAIIYNIIILVDVWRVYWGVAAKCSVYEFIIILFKMSVATYRIVCIQCSCTYHLVQFVLIP